MFIYIIDNAPYLEITRFFFKTKNCLSNEKVEKNKKCIAPPFQGKGQSVSKGAQILALVETEDWKTLKILNLKTKDLIIVYL